jgi:glycosyltransferase involved in cell wall biosynthesis
MSTEVLYISHNGLTEPLGRRQVLPYLVGLGERGWRFSVVSFEKSEQATPEARDEVLAALRGVSARWIPLAYHRRPPVLATLYDAAVSLWATNASGLRPRLIHARSTVPAALASVLSRRFRVPWIFDLRGLLAQEYVDAGHWKAHWPRARITAASERHLLRSADGVVVLTRRLATELRSAGQLGSETPIEVVPCMTDLREFRPDSEARRQVRAALGMPSAKILVYSGSLGSWYRIDEMLAFYAVARQQMPELRLLVLTPQPGAARAAAARAGVSDAVVLELPPPQVPRHLAAADAGICFLGDLPSKRASSPTKYGEYLAAGLPVVTNSWTGDAAELDGQAPWILLDGFGDAEYRRAAARLQGLLARPDETRAEARGLAAQAFALDVAIDRYERLYRRLQDGAA